MIEHQHRKTRPPARSVIEEVFSRNHQQPLIVRDFFVRETNKFLELRNPRPANREAREGWQG